MRSLFACLLCLLLAACGSSADRAAPVTTAPTTTITSTSSEGGEVVLWRQDASPADVERAKRSTLQASDLPAGFGVIEEGRVRELTVAEHEANKCFGYVDLRGVTSAEYDGEVFERMTPAGHAVRIAQTIEIRSDQAAADASERAYDSQEYLECLKAFVKAELRKELGSDVDELVLIVTPTPINDYAEDTRVTSVVLMAGLTFEPVYTQQVVSVREGRAFISVSMAYAGDSPGLTQQEMQALLDLSRQRAKTALAS